jgi:hypothetical protein
MQPLLEAEGTRVKMVLLGTGGGHYARKAAHVENERQYEALRDKGIQSLGPTAEIQMPSGPAQGPSRDGSVQEL